MRNCNLGQGDGRFFISPIGRLYGIEVGHDQVAALKPVGALLCPAQAEPCLALQMAVPENDRVIRRQSHAREIKRRGQLQVATRSLTRAGRPRNTI